MKPLGAANLRSVWLENQWFLLNKISSLNRDVDFVAMSTE